VPRARPRTPKLAVLVEEAENVLEPKPTIATLADPIEQELAAVAEPLDRVDVEMKHLSATSVAVSIGRVR
jgi:hypothetical protein